MKIFQSFRAVQKVTFFFKIGLFGQPLHFKKRPCFLWIPAGVYPEQRRRVGMTILVAANSPRWVLFDDEHPKHQSPVRQYRIK
jgi:hypothetical protein